MSNPDDAKPAPRHVPEFAHVYHNDPTYGDRFAMLYDWTWEIPLSPQARTLYAYLLHRCGSVRQWGITQAVIAEAIQVGVRRLSSYIDELVEQGMITVENQQKLSAPSIYRIRTKAEVAATQSLIALTLRPKLRKGHPSAKTAGGLRQNCVSLTPKLPNNKDVDTPPDTNVDRETPPTPRVPAHSRGEDGGGGVAPLQFRSREDPPSVDGRTSTHQWSPDILATTAELATIIGLPCDQDFMEAWAPHVQRAFTAGVPAADLTGCLRWMWSDPAQYWQRNRYTLGVKAIRSQMVTWRGEGRPATRQTAAAGRPASAPTILTHEQAQASATVYCRGCRMNAPAHHKPNCKSGLSGPVGAPRDG